MIRIGTRASALALAQAGWVADRLGADTELVAITTAGDHGDAAPADKSRWVSGLEQALLNDEIDLAVHSAKDVPGELPDGLELVAFTSRADPRDAICGARSLAALHSGARVGTSSLRRTAQLLAAREDLEIVNVRGNVETRLRKLAAGEADALVLAIAGLQRLGRAGDAGGLLAELVPAAGQGALALEARPGGVPAAALAGVVDADATACVTAERELVRALDATCDTPVGAHARPLGDGSIELRGWAGLPDGSAWVGDRLRGSPQGLGLAVAQRMVAAGAAQLLDRAVRAGAGAR